MVHLNKDQAIYAAQTFMSFLNIAKETQNQNRLEFEGYRAKALLLFEQVIANQLEPSAAIEQINQLIKEVNQLLKAPYPQFMTDTSENLVKGEIVAFEHYLNQELKANDLTIQEEAPLFNDSLNLWEKVGVSLTPQEGVSELASLVAKLNRFLPEDKHYPEPNQIDTL